MSNLKTQPTNKDVSEFLKKVQPEQKRKDSFEILELMKDVTGEKPVMWGDNIVGFGKYHYKYASGREGDWFLTGFSPRKQNISIYIMSGFDKYEDLMKDLGKYKNSVSCLYINKLEDIDKSLLKELIKSSVGHMKKTN